MSGTESTKNWVPQLDIIRILACFCILTIHFNASVCGYDRTGAFDFPENAFMAITCFGGVYLGNLGTALFFMLTGASLETRYKSFDPLSVTGVLEFYKKRCRSIYPLFWLAFIVATCIYPWRTFPPLQNIGVSLLGLDGYLLTFGSSLGTLYKVGEWFLGCVLCIYAFYPFLAYFFHKYPKITFIFSAGIYILCIQRLNQIWFFFQFPHVLLGMALIRNMDNDRFKTLVFSVALALLLLRYPLATCLSPWTISLITAMAIFEIIFYSVPATSPHLLKIKAPLRKLSCLTYPAFLVHHVLISSIAARLDLEKLTRPKVVMLYFCYIGLSIFLAWGLVGLYRALSFSFEALKRQKNKTEA